jgi:hypothetical protein
MRRTRPTVQANESRGIKEEETMKRMVRRILVIGPRATLASWLAPVAAHAGLNQNHNETLVRSR